MFFFLHLRQRAYQPFVLIIAGLIVTMNQIVRAAAQQISVKILAIVVMCVNPLREEIGGGNVAFLHMNMLLRLTDQIFVSVQTASSMDMRRDTAVRLLVATGLMPMLRIQTDQLSVFIKASRPMYMTGNTAEDFLIALFLMGMLLRPAQQNLTIAFFCVDM